VRGRASGALGSGVRLTQHRCGGTGRDRPVCRRLRDRSLAEFLGAL